MEDFSFNPKYNAIVGYNGMGKTNLLDAIYFTCMTKSNFTNSDRNLILSGESFLRTEAMLLNKKIVSKFAKGKKKVFEVNGKSYSKLADHIGKFPIVFVVPNDQNLLLEGSIERRKLLDNSISQIDTTYLNHLIKYNTLLKQRNAYLKLGLKTGNTSDKMLMTYAEQMLASCDFIYERRKEFTSEFSKIFQAKYFTISGDQEKASCEYKSHLADADFLSSCTENIQKDRILGRTTIGIHKDDLVFKMNTKSVKYFASQGQTKSFILSLKLAQFEILANTKGIKPILLLDDLFDKLDHRRVKQLITLLEKEEVGQVFISDTDSTRVVKILESMSVDYMKITINNGRKNISDKASEEE